MRENSKELESREEMRQQLKAHANSRKEYKFPFGTMYWRSSELGGPLNASAGIIFINSETGERFDFVVSETVALGDVERQIEICLDLYEILVPKIMKMRAKLYNEIESEQDIFKRGAF